ncbi:MAG: hypothetical protein PVH61_42975 [Candidatus Aminicenantes bacterium]|jgi:hypothetical protein
MTGSKRILDSKVMIFSLIIIVFSLCVSLYPRISCNGSGSSYDGPGDGDSAFANDSVESMVVEGAGFYLQANSSIQSFLNQVELQDVRGIDYPEMQGLIANAVENITNARLAYERLVETAERTPYNPVVIEQLKDFDYDSFMLEKRVNQVIFNQVRGYLSTGNITGAFRHGLSVIKSIRWLLFIVANYVLFDQLPGLEISWKLNELCAEFSLFGSYTARIFQSIDKKY